MINQVQIKQKQHNPVTCENELAGFVFIADEATWWRMKSTSSSLIMEPPKTTCQPQTLENCGLFYRGNMWTRWMVQLTAFCSLFCMVGAGFLSQLCFSPHHSQPDNIRPISTNLFWWEFSEVIHLIHQSLLWARRNTRDVFWVKTRKQTSMSKVCRISLLSCQNLSFVGLLLHFHSGFLLSATRTVILF